MRATPPRKSGSGEAEARAATRRTTQGEFAGIGRWLVTASRRPAQERVSTPTAPAITGLENFAATDSFSLDTDLGALLGAIAEDVHQIAAAVSAGIMADFATRVAYARRHLPRHQLGGALHALAEARKAALAVARRNAAMELKARKKAALIARRRSPQRPNRNGRGSSKPTPIRH